MKSPLRAMRAVHHKCQYGARRSGAATIERNGRRQKRKLTKPERLENPAVTALGRKQSGELGPKGVPCRWTLLCNRTRRLIKAGEDLLPVATLKKYAARTDARAKEVLLAGMHGDRARNVNGYLRSIRVLRAHQKVMNPQRTFATEKSSTRFTK